MSIHFRRPPMMFWLPLSKPINDGSRDPRLARTAPVFTDNTMPERDWSKYDKPAKLRMKKKRFTPPVLCMRQAS